ncbi:hypothetical protein Tco_1310674 [Tanacetum coccineum]
MNQDCSSQRGRIGGSGDLEDIASTSLQSTGTNHNTPIHRSVKRRVLGGWYEVEAKVDDSCYWEGRLMKAWTRQLGSLVFLFRKMRAAGRVWNRGVVRIVYAVEGKLVLDEPGAAELRNLLLSECGDLKEQKKALIDAE